jgi:hypothetical protein
MSGWQITLLVIIIVMIAAIVALYFLGRRAQKKKEEQDAQIAAAAQTVTMLIIDKKRMRLKDAGLPQQVVEQTPKLMRRSKLPIVKAKVGPKVMSLIADEAIFEEIPVKKEVKATVSGLYITGVKGLRGPLEKPQKKKGFRAKLRDKYDSLNAEMKAEKAAEEKSKASKKKK